MSEIQDITADRIVIGDAGRSFIIDRGEGTILEKTDSKVLPEVVFARLDGLGCVRLTHRLRKPDTTTFLLQELAPVHVWGLYVRQKAEHPDSPGRALAVTHDPAERECLIAIAGKIADFAGVEVLKDDGFDMEPAQSGGHEEEEGEAEENVLKGGIPAGLSPQELAEAEEEQQRFIVKVYGWMCLALVTTGVVAMAAMATPALMESLTGNTYVLWGLIITELILVATLASLVAKMSVPVATTVFLGYAALTGVTFSVVFLAFTSESIVSALYITAGTFGTMSLYGYVTKRDLTSIGQLCIMGLIGLIIASVTDLWYGSDKVYWVTTYGGILVFIGLTAYDTQKVKRANIIGNEGSDEDSREAIIGALVLYLDFVNLFLRILRATGRSRK